jgi:hypothetical protein
MSTRWKWSRTRVRNFLKTLKKEQQIEQQKTSVTSIITILNYEKFQGEEQQEEQQSGQQKNSRRTAEEQQKNINKNVKKNKNDKKKDIYTPEFESWFNDYPNQWDKEQSAKNWQGLIKAGVSVETILKATENYKKYITVRQTDKQYIIRSTNFIGRKREYKNYLELKPEDLKPLTKTKADTSKRRIHLPDTRDLKTLYGLEE